MVATSDLYIAAGISISNVMSPSSSSRPSARPSSTLTEARIQALCAHPNVVSVYDVRIEPPVPMIVMEYLPGGSAEDRVTEGIALMDALRWTRNALQGLAHAHRLGILHRDLKPGNLLVLANGEAALSDSGIAEDTVRGRFATDKHYWPLVAPELLDLRPTSVQSDVWAMGCLLYRLLTGRWPFLSVDDIRAAKYQPPQRSNPQVTRALSRVVAGALEPDLAQRFTSARNMLAEVAKCRADCSWVRCDEDGAVEAWTTSIEGAQVAARVLHAPRGNFEVEVTIDRGSSPSPRSAQPAVLQRGTGAQPPLNDSPHRVEGKALR